ncbi:MAG: hypothetical protein E6I73_01825 [Chloroflexi bacterium]|nr:MAG: hypothetical protein E6I73_01825 [Chloroflexota bacterium]
MKSGRVRVPHARLYVASAAVIGCAAILWLARGFTFYFDEWTLILPTDTGWAQFLQPHNEHPVMIPRLIYSVLLNTVGMRSYVPYMVVLLALHAASVMLLFELVCRRAGEAVAIAAAVLLLVMGAAWENLLWAFQITFVGSVACGLGALLVIDTGRRMWLVLILLFGSLMFSGIGLFFWVAAAVWLLLTPTRRRDLAWLAPVAIVFGGWYLAYGHSGAPPRPVSLVGNMAALPFYVFWGLGAAAAGLVGEGGWIGIALLVLAILALAFTWRRRPPDAYAIGIAAGLLTFYIVTGVNRAQLGYQQSGSGRYVYEGAVFWLLLLADPARELPWRGTWRPALIACVFLASFNSGVLLFAYSAAKTVQMQRETADLQALAAARANSCVDPHGAVDQLVMPQVDSPPDYYRAVDRYGDPAAGTAQMRDADYHRALANLLKPGCA